MYHQQLRIIVENCLRTNLNVSIIPDLVRSSDFAQMRSVFAFLPNIISVMQLSSWLVPIKYLGATRII